MAYYTMGLDGLAPRSTPAQSLPSATLMMTLPKTGHCGTKGKIEVLIQTYFRFTLCLFFSFTLVRSISAQGTVPWAILDTLETLSASRLNNSLELRALVKRTTLVTDAQLNCIRQIQRGLFLEANAQYAEAIKTYELARLHISTNEPLLHYYLVYRICYNYYDLGQFEEIINRLKNLPQKVIDALQSSNKRRIADYYNLLALAYKKNGNLTEAKATYLLGIQKCDGDEISQCNKLKFNLIKTLTDQADYSEALIQTQNLLEFYRTKKDTTYLVALLTDLADIHKELRNYAYAEHYYKKALTQCGTDTASIRASRIYEGLGILSSYQNRPIASSTFLKKALEIDRFHHNKVGICYGINNLCKNLIFHPSHQENVLGLLQESLKIASEIGDHKAQHYALFLQGIYLQQHGNYHSAIIYLTQSLYYHQKQKMQSIVIDIQSRLSTCYENLGQTKKALTFKKLELQSKDSLYNTEKIMAFEEASEKYESRNKDLQIAKQKIEVLEKDRRLSTVLRYGIVLGLILLILLIITFAIYSTTNQKLIVKKEELRTKVDDLKSFIYSVSHDLRGPITRIRNQILLLELPQTHEDELPKRLHIIDQTSQQLGLLLDELLNLAMLDHLEQRFRSFNPMEMLAEIVDELGATIIKNHIEVVLETTDPKTTLEGDRVLLRQVFLNIITNAIKFCQGQPNPKITIRHLHGPLRHIVTVADNGIGIEAKELDHIFELFVKGKNALGIEGAGAGLAIAKKIVMKHSGEISASANEEGGLTITVGLPNK